MMLEDRLSQLSVGTDKERMYSKWKIIKEDTEAKLKTVCSYFPHFSKHDGSHSHTISIHIGNLLGEDRINKLSYSDILIMLICFYKHDVGMALEYEEIYNRFHDISFNDILNKYINDKTSDLSNIASRLKNFDGRIKENDYESSIDVYNDVILIVEDIYRSNHAERSAEAVMKDTFLENTVHSRIQKIIAEICAVHQKSINDISKLEYKENGLFGDYFHPRFIAAMLCLGDLLDLDTDRFDQIMIKASTPFPHLSKLHLEKHKSVRHFLVSTNNIELCADTKDIEVYRIFRKWMDWMQEACDYIALHWSEISPVNFGNAPRITKCDLLLNGNTKWLSFADTKYEISNKRMFELLKGSNIYKNKFVCIREIVQNAVDATLLRLFDEEILSGNDDSLFEQLKGIKWDNYKILGKISVVDDNHVLVMIRDRGIGVSKDDIKKIANVSNVYSNLKKELISKMPMWLRPAGAFGMGLQSIYLLTDQFEIITKTANEAAKKITFQSAENSDGYIMVEDYNEPFTQGTEIRFIIDGEKLSATELYCSTYHYKRKKISGFMISKIYSEYNNHSSIPANRAKLKETDYVPVEIEFEQPAYKIKPIIEYKPLFKEHELNSIEVCDGKVSIKKFIPMLNCHITGFICLSHRRSDDEPHTYGDINDLQTGYMYNRALFYRNTYVEDDILHRTLQDNIPIISYFSWRINLLDDNSDAVLQINRNSINESYAGTLCKTLVKAFDMAANDIIDYLIEHDCNEDIGDTILLIYQFSLQLDSQKSDKVYNKYRDLLDNIKINNYFKWGEDDEKNHLSKHINELRKQPLYFIVEKIECDQGISSHELKEHECLILNSHVTSYHILNHKIKRLFLGKIGMQHFKVIEAVPFEFNSKESLYEIDDIFMLENIVRMINLNLRVIPATKGYEILVTPISPSSDIITYSYRNEQYYIEMPFADLMLEMTEILHAEGYINEAFSKYYVKITSSSLFSENVDYITDTNKKIKSDVEVKYQQLVKKCLELLQESKYIEFNKYILKKTDEENMQEFHYRDLIDLNNYTTHRIDLLD